MWPDLFEQSAIGPLPTGSLVAAVAVWMVLLETCPRLTDVALELARVGVLYILARG